MSSTTEILHDLIYPSIYENLETVLPEFRFKKKGHDDGYVSTNGAKIDGGTGDAQGRVRVYSDNISRLIDHRIGSISIWNYIQQREGLDINDRRGTLLKLAELAEVKLPERDLSADEMENLKAYLRRSEIWEKLNTYLKGCFYDENNELAKSNEAKEVRAYLLNKRELGGRGFHPGDIETSDPEDKSKVIEAGVLVDPVKAYRHLMDLGYEEQELRDTLKLTEDGRIGKAGYILSFPYRDSSGSIRGLLIRNIKFNPTNKDKEPKYLFTKSLDGIKGKLLYNLRPPIGKKDLLIVESQIDAQLATVRGIENVVAIGGKNLTTDQVKQALTMRPKINSITLLLDNEPETIPQIKAAIDTILKLNQDPAISIYVAEIKENSIKDLEEYLVTHDADKFKSEVFSNKIIYWRWLLNNTISQHLDKTKDRELTDTDEDEFLKAVLIQGNNITHPIHKEKYLARFTELIQESAAFTQQALAETARILKNNQQSEVQRNDLKKLLAKVQDLQSKGDIGGALDLLTTKGREIKEDNHTAEFNGLLLPPTEDQVKQRLSVKPDSLEAGYKIGNEDLLIPSGAISIIAAPTSHGKTTFLINLALNVAERYKRKHFHIFSYEEDSDSVLVSALSSYIGEPVCGNNRRSIKSFYKDGNLKWFTDGKENLFLAKKNEFFNNLIAPRRLNIHYVDYSSDTLIDAIYYLHKNADIGAVFIDYMQLLHKGEGGNNKYGTRQEELKQICLDLKDVAVDTGLPIILGAQFNRTVLNPADIHATRIGEAGDIERIANLILGFWNNNFESLATDDEIKKMNRDGLIKEGALLVKILKQRGGAVGGQGFLNYNGNVGKISNERPSADEKKPTISF